MVKLTDFLWLLREKAVLREGQADSTLTGYHKISATKSQISFHFYVTLLLEKRFGKKHMVCASLQYMWKQGVLEKFCRLQGRIVFTHTHHLSSSLCQATGNLYMLMAKAQTVG